MIEDYADGRALKSQRLAELTQRVNALSAFQDAWSQVDKLAMKVCNDESLDGAMIEDFNRLRGQANLLLPGVQDMIGPTGAARTQYGTVEQTDIFGYLLEEVPHLASFKHQLHGRGYTERFLEMRARSSAYLLKAQGRLEKEISDLESGPDIIDSIEELSIPLGLSEFHRHLRGAEADLDQGDSQDAIHSCRRALERLVTEMANLIAKEQKKRTFADAMVILREHAIVDGPTAKAITTPNIGLFGWTSEHGTHDQDSPDVELLRGEEEARLSIRWTRAVIRYLLERYRKHVNSDAG